MTEPISSTGSMGQVQVAVQGPAPPRIATSDTPDTHVETASNGSGRGTSTTPSSERDHAVLMDLNTRTLKGSKDVPPPTIEDATKALRAYLKALPSNLQFRADQESGYYTFKVVNPITQEVIRQFPPDEMLEMAKRITEQLANKETGILLDKKL